MRADRRSQTAPKWLPIHPVAKSRNAGRADLRHDGRRRQLRQVAAAERSHATINITIKLQAVAPERGRVVSCGVSALHVRWLIAGSHPGARQDRRECTICSGVADAEDRHMASTTKQRVRLTPQVQSGHGARTLSSAALQNHSVVYPAAMNP